ncbi:MAG TPA: DUF1223 domain-containing protein [Micavibrio sp.]|nr:DUF1223 domain-containing protein [Micavibrio sp.]
MLNRSKHANPKYSSQMINVRLTFLMFLGLFMVPMWSFAQDEGPNVAAQPVEAVSDESLVTLAEAPVIVELFSSQACVFCPRADTLFNDLIEDDSVIGLSCHVDYFDVRNGALSHKFCTDQQTKYAQQLASGPNYTPQIVINGVQDVVGYKFDKVLAAVTGARMSTVQTLKLTKGQGGNYTIKLPADITAETNEFRLMIYDKVKDVTIADGRNKGKKMTYKNIVSTMKPLVAQNGTLTFKPEIKPANAGFVVIAQDSETGAITGVVQGRL